MEYKLRALQKLPEIVLKVYPDAKPKMVYGTGILKDSINTWIISNKENTAIAYGRCEDVVDENTIGQSTGYNDKNDVEIYAGDIYDIGMCYKYIRPEYFIEDTYELIQLLKDNATIQVVGNIFENPDLMEVN